MSTLDDLAGVQGTSLDDPSGALAAQAAHEAGAVLPALELPVQLCELLFRVHAPAAEARELVDAIAERLAGHPLVLAPITCSVREPTA